MRSAVSFLEFKFENANGQLMDLAGKVFQISNRTFRAETGIKILGISVVLWNCNRICVKSSGFRVGAADVPGCEWKTAPSVLRHTHATKAGLGGHNTPGDPMGPCGELRAALGPLQAGALAVAGKTRRLGMPGVLINLRRYLSLF